MGAVESTKNQVSQGLRTASRGVAGGGKKHTLAADEYTKIEPLFLISIFKIFKINYPLLPPGPRPCPPWAASKRLGGGWWGQ